jgi:di/tricarboxylate transporter
VRDMAKAGIALDIIAVVLVVVVVLLVYPLVFA